MCNCGSKRNEIISADAAKKIAAPLPAQSAKMWPDVRFRYTGKTALTITGNTTGKRYRFEQPGSEIPVDFRDAAGMLTVAVLRRV